MHSPSPCRPLSLSLRRGVSGTGMNGPWTRPIDRWNNSFRASSAFATEQLITRDVINNCLIIPYSLNFPLVSVSNDKEFKEKLNEQIVQRKPLFQKFRKLKFKFNVHESMEIIRLRGNDTKRNFEREREREK